MLAGYLNHMTLPRAGKEVSVVNKDNGLSPIIPPSPLISSQLAEIL